MSTNLQTSTGIQASTRNHRASVTFGARAAILAGVVAATCAVSAPSATSAAAGHQAAHATALALGATPTGAVAAMDTTCCS